LAKARFARSVYNKNVVQSKYFLATNTVKPLILVTLILAFESINYIGPRNFSVFASYYTEMLLYSNFRGPLFSRTCQAREIKGTQKTGFTVIGHCYTSIIVQEASLYNTTC